MDDGGAFVEPGRCRFELHVRWGFRASMNRASEAETCESAPHSVWAEVGEASAVDRAVGVAAGSWKQIAAKEPITTIFITFDEGGPMSPANCAAPGPEL